MKNKLISFLTLIVMLMSSITIVNASKDLDIDMEVKGEEAKLNYTITFNLPTVVQEEPEEVDIVFVMDTTAIDGYAETRAEINEFLDHVVTNDNIKVNVGVVKFAQNVTDASGGLQPLNEDTLETVKGYFAPALVAGSNMYGGVLIGKEMLDSGSAEPSNKYLIVASDFGGYKGDAGDGIGLSLFPIYSSGTVISDLTNNTDFNAKYYYTERAGSELTVFTEEAVDNFIRNKVFFNGTPVSSENEIYLTESGPSVGEYPDSYAGLKIGSYVITPPHDWTEEEKATLVVSPRHSAADFPTMFEKNIYRTGQEFLAMSEDGYNVIAVTSPYQPEDGSNYKRKFNAASNAYKDWFESNIGKRYEITEGETFSDLLDDLEAELIYLLGKGEIVDVVHDDFKVVGGYEKVLLNGVELTSTTLDNGDIAFGEAVDGVYPYVYHYEEVDGKEEITWTLNKEARKDDLLQFVFTVELKELPTEVGVHSKETNASAEVNYMSSKEVLEGETEYTQTTTLPSPTVDIIIGGVKVEYIDEDTGLELTPSLNLQDLVGRPYTTEQKSFDGYNFVSVNEPSEKVFTEGITTITYLYKRIVSLVEVHYIDEETGEYLHHEVIEDYVGVDYITTHQDFEGYEFVRVEGETNGLHRDGKQDVYYYYRKTNTNIETNKGMVTSYYLDKETTKQLAPPLQQSGIVGDNYLTLPLEIEGYYLVSTSGNTKGSYQDSPQTVTYYYQKIIVEEEVAYSISGSNFTISKEEALNISDNSLIRLANVQAINTQSLEAEEVSVLFSSLKAEVGEYYITFIVTKDPQKQLTVTAKVYEEYYYIEANDFNISYYQLREEVNDGNMDSLVIKEATAKGWYYHSDYGEVEKEITVDISNFIRR